MKPSLASEGWLYKEAKGSQVAVFCSECETGGLHDRRPLEMVSVGNDMYQCPRCTRVKEDQGDNFFLNVSPDQVIEARSSPESKGINVFDALSVGVLFLGAASAISSAFSSSDEEE